MGRIRVKGQINILLILIFSFEVISNIVCSIRRALNGKLAYLIATVGRIRVNRQKDIVYVHI